MSPSASWAWWVIPTVARSPSTRIHSCSLVYFRSSGYMSTLSCLPRPVATSGRMPGSLTRPPGEPPTLRRSQAQLSPSCQGCPQLCHGLAGPPDRPSGARARGRRADGLLRAPADHPAPRGVVGDERVLAHDPAVLGDGTVDGDVEARGTLALDDRPPYRHPERPGRAQGLVRLQLH